MIKRYFTSILGAFAITFSLFLGMHFLIKTDDAKRPEFKERPDIIVGKVEEPNDPIKEIEKPPKPEEPIVKINIPIDLTTTTENPIGPDVGTNMPKPANPFGKHSFGIADGDILAIAKYSPEYPRSPLEKGIEGYVIVKFTVNKMGAVENAVIVESTNSAFNRSSLRAVERFKYKPRVIDGVAVEVHGVMEKVSFELEKSS